MNKRGHVINAIVLGLGLGYMLEPAGGTTTAMSTIEIGIPVVLGALFPDVDTAFGKHRKTLHNLPVLASFVAFPLYFAGNLQYVWVGILTHYVLDVAGSTRGIAMFYPLWSREFGLPIGVNVSSKVADTVTVLVTVGELVLAAAIIYWLPDQGIELSSYVTGL